MTDDKLYVHFVVYDDGADLEVDYDGGEPTVTNHDELVDSGQTYDAVRVLNDSEQNREHIGKWMIVDEDDPMWREEFADMEIGDEYRFDELQIAE